MVDTEAFWVETEDWHTAGEPFRIVSKLPPQCTTTGATVWDRRLNIINESNHPLDLLRQSLCHEPRGHTDMYGGFIVPPNNSGAHFGVLFWHKDGFSTACGHGTIALGRWAVSKGIVQPVQEGTVQVMIDVPSGRVTAHVVFHNGAVAHVDFTNVASYQFAKQLLVNVHHNGSSLSIKVDLSWGGATYASVDCGDLDLQISPSNYQQFVALGREIKAALGKAADHAQTPLYAVCFFEAMDDNTEAITQKNVVVFADGQIDRSPCGSGTCARVAVLLAQGKLNQNKKLVHHSIINTSFEANIVSQKQGNDPDFPVCFPLVRGNASLTGRHNFYIDPKDPTYPGFFFR